MHHHIGGALTDLGEPAGHQLCLWRFSLVSFEEMGEVGGDGDIDQCSQQVDVTARRR